jgi:hypothetical protein
VPQRHLRRGGPLDPVERLMMRPCRSVYWDDEEDDADEWSLPVSERGRKLSGSTCTYFQKSHVVSPNWML